MHASWVTGNFNCLLAWLFFRLNFLNSPNKYNTGQAKMMMTYCSSVLNMYAKHSLEIVFFYFKQHVLIWIHY